MRSKVSEKSNENLAINQEAHWTPDLKTLLREVSLAARKGKVFILQAVGRHGMILPAVSPLLDALLCLLFPP
jgi:hypothetical protein